MTPTLAITGGTGFVGGHLIAAALARGFRVRALARRPQPERDGLSWTPGALDDPAALAVLCDGADCAIHVAGATNAGSLARFWAVNVAGTGAMLAAAGRAGVRRFVQVSSLAAREPQLSDYGASKAAADALVRASGLDWVIVRPPAVYGPGDREMLELVRSVARGFAPAIGQGRFSLIYVTDLAAALLALAAAPDAPSAAFEVDDGAGGVTHAAFARATGRAIGRAPLIVPIAPALLKLIARANAAAARAMGRTPKLTLDRARYFAHPDWTADSGPLIATGLWRPQVGLDEGLARTVAWYRGERWL